jgi:hypothetical protein
LGAREAADLRRGVICAVLALLANELRRVGAEMRALARGELELEHNAEATGPAEKLAPPPTTIPQERQQQQHQQPHTRQREQPPPQHQHAMPAKQQVRKQEWDAPDPLDLHDPQSPSPLVLTLAAPVGAAPDAATAAATTKTANARVRQGSSLIKSLVLDQVSPTATSMASRAGLAESGDGEGGPLSQSQLVMIDELFAKLQPERAALEAALPHEQGWCDLETCRRYLVARQWKPAKAEAQLRSTLEWRLAENPAKLDFWQSPRALKNPHALSMRCVGFDSRLSRPVVYTSFAEANDRFDVADNMAHLTALLEACAKTLRLRRAAGLGTTAQQRQWVWVISFDGFGMRDQSPRSAMVTASLMQHYPEMLSQCVLLDAPWLFSATWNLLSKVLDDRVREKVLFVKGDEVAGRLAESLGAETAAWFFAEAADSKAKRAVKGAPLRKYWLAPSSAAEHDPRGMATYTSSVWYIKTPGDAYVDQQQAVKAKP